MFRTKMAVVRRCVNINIQRKASGLYYLERRTLCVMTSRDLLAFLQLFVVSKKYMRMNVDSC